LYPVLYWILFILVALSPIAARLGTSILHGKLPESLVKLGDYWMAAIYYLVVAWVLIDFLRLISRLIAPNFTRVMVPSPCLGVGILIMLISLLTYGTLNAAQTRVQHYKINIEKTAPGLKALKAVLVSDTHLGTTMNISRLQKLVSQVNDLQPDIVFMPGDIIDGDLDYFSAQGMDKLLRQINAPLGVFAVLGNHEYLGGSGELVSTHLHEAGIVVLQDNYLLVQDLFYVVGREDRMANRFTGLKRLTLPEIMNGMNKDLPIILMDHQPYDLSEAELSGIDLQLSGHTHHGQFFPNDFVTNRIFEVDWGYLKKGDLHVIVTCGYGTWGPPIRIGSHSEIVVIDITFAND